MARLRFACAAPAIGCRRLLAFSLGLALLAASPGAARAAAPALAETGRIEVNAMEYPWSAIGRVNAGGRGHCTGFLIGEREVLTAAHCLYDRRNGRWRKADEVHFVAGYQRDTYLIHSRVRSYERSRAFDVAAGATAANATADWAVLSLREPIGRQAGWLGLRRPDSDLLERLERGEAQALQAGYRHGFTHIMSVSLDCAIAGFFQDRRGLVHSCVIAKGDSGSPLLVFDRGRIGVAGLHVIDARTEDARVAGALSVALFHPAGGDRQAVRAVGRAAEPWSGGRAPQDASPAAALPLRTIDALLARRGHLARAGAAERRAAIAAFEAGAGLPVTGEASLTLLGALLGAGR